MKVLFKKTIQGISRYFRGKSISETSHDDQYVSPIHDYETQFSDSSEEKSTYIIIGFDFGTATTKVVIRDPWARRAFAIPFSDTTNLSTGSYLLPTKLVINSDNEFYIPKITDACPIVNLKMDLVDNYKKIVFTDPSLNVSMNAFAAVSIYIACVLRYIRKWFFNNCSDIYMKNKIIWQLHLGIPTKNYDDRTTKDIFEKCAMWGWWLSIQRRPINVSLISQISENIDKATFNLGIHPDYINVFPEVAAEVAGYARSPMRDDGLHLLVDIGASTLDVTTFVLHGKGEHQYAFLSTDVKRLGAFELHKKRLGIITEILQHSQHADKWKQVFDKLNDATLPVPTSLEEYCDYVPKSEKERILKNLDELEEKLINDTGFVIRKIIAVTKEKRDPLSSKWQEGLPVFVCGGGSILNFYKYVIKDSEECMKKIGCKCFKIMDLPTPEGLQAKGLSHNDYHRIAVAYGLSFPFEDIGKIIPPSEIEDIVHKKKIKEVEYISKDMV